MNRNLTRCSFIRTILTLALAAGAFPTIVPATVLGRQGQTAANSRIVSGAIGVGPQGRGVMGGFLSQTSAQVVAVCDVKKDQLELARKQVNDRYQNADCATYEDFRGLLARKDIEAVLIATPDHWHVYVAVAAAQAGKDMYLEKPMGLSLAEDQMLRKAIKKHKRVFQFGTQQRSSREFQRACELGRTGRIGQLKQINVWSAASHPGGSTTPAPVPDDGGKRLHRVTGAPQVAAQSGARGGIVVDDQDGAFTLSIAIKAWRHADILQRWTTGGYNTLVLCHALKDDGQAS